MTNTALPIEVLPPPYDPIRLLKRGPVGSTILAMNRATGASVVVKRIGLDGLTPEERRRLLLESTRLKTQPRSGATQIIDAVEESNQLHVVMPYVEGVTLRERLETSRLDVEDTLTVAAHLLRGLVGLHSLGEIHRDIKPTNIIVNPVPPVQRATLVDFGFATTAARPVAGSPGSYMPLHMAPELVGLLDRPVDARADLYSVGTVLFECLVGSPLVQNGPTESLGDHLARPIPRVRSLGIRIPQALEDILRRLLHKDPDDRYSSADAALADIEAVADGLRDGVVEPEVTVGSCDTRVTLTEPPLTGREGELSFLAECLSDAVRGVAGLITIEAGPGCGKSAVLNEFCERAQSLGAWVFRGRGVEHSAPRPLQMLTGIVHDLVQHARANPAMRNDLLTRLGDSAGPLCAALPELGEILLTPVWEPRESETLARRRLIHALLALVDALGRSGQPGIIALDDCQWADELTLEVLENWNARRVGYGAPRRNILIVAAMRDEQTAQYQRLTNMAGIARLPLPPLDNRQTGRVIASMAGHLPVAACEVIARLSQGNPLMISAVLRGLFETEALTPSVGGWDFAQNTAGWQASREAAAFLAGRFELLAPTTRALLDAAAVLGRDFDIELAGKLINLDPLTARLAIGPALERHLVWAAPDGRVTFAHDKLRASLLAQLDPGRLAVLHMHAAEHLERRNAGLTFELAYHFDAAGDSKRAFEYAIESAASARARHDFELAERLYRIAERGLGDVESRMQCAVLEAAGQVLMLRGRYDEAAERFARARALAVDDLSLARIEGQLGEVLFRQDDLIGSARRIEAGLRVLGEWVPDGATFRVIVRLLFEISKRPAARLRRRDVRKSEADREGDRVRSHLYTQLEYPKWFASSRLQALCLMVRQVNVAERCPNSSELAHAYAVSAAGWALTFPFAWRYAERYVNRSRRIYHLLGDRRGQGHAASMRACVLHAAGRYEQAYAAASEAVVILGQFGDPWELGFAVRNQAVCLYRLGLFAQARQEARRLLEIGLESNDAQARVTALEILAKCTGGDVAAGLTLHRGNGLDSDVEVTVAALQAEALRLQRTGRLREGIAKLDLATEAVRSSRPPSTHLVPVFAWLATLQREDAESLVLPHIRQERLVAARRSARRAVRYGYVYRNDLPHALRELGIIHALLGHRRRAKRHLMRSCSAATKRGARAELAESESQLDRLELASRSRPGHAVVERDEPSAARPGSTNWGLSERFSALLHSGAVIAAADSPEAVGRAVEDSVRSLMRAEHCRLIALTPAFRLATTEVTAEEREIAARTVEYGRPLILGDHVDQADPATAGLNLIGARSALCAPIYLQGELAGCFLATHSQVGKLFGDLEIQLAEFVARLASAAMERQQLERDSRARVIAAQEAERARVARDLHDDVGQALTSVLLGVRLVESAARTGNSGPSSSDSVLARTGELREEVVAVLESVQRLAFDLRPSVLDDMGLADALRWLAARMSNGTMDVEFEALGLGAGRRLPTEIETTAYRITQEALTNSIRHAQGSRCSVIVSFYGDELRVVVEDDGDGFQADGRRSRGLGLLGMKERADLVGGNLRVTSSAGRGTQVLFEVVIDHAD